MGNLAGVSAISFRGHMLKNKYGLPENIEGSNNGHWKGGLHVRKDGYVLVRKGVIRKKEKGTRYILQHRMVMENHLGRKLLRSEIVHHKNGNKSDNSIGNLELMTQSKHAKLHLRQDPVTGRLLSNKKSIMTKSKPAPKTSSNPKNAEKPANIKAVFGTPNKSK